MRLINADSIEWEYKCVSKEEIDEYPTIEAVPVDYLITHGRDLVTMKDRKFNSDCMAFLYTIVFDWREENEQRQDS